MTNPSREGIGGRPKNTPEGGCHIHGTEDWRQVYLREQLRWRCYVCKRSWKKPPGDGPSKAENPRSATIFECVLECGHQGIYREPRPRRGELQYCYYCSTFKLTVVVGRGKVRVVK